MNYRSRNIAYRSIGYNDTERSFLRDSISYYRYNENDLLYPNAFISFKDAERSNPRDPVTHFRYSDNDLLYPNAIIGNNKIDVLIGATAHSCWNDFSNVLNYKPTIDVIKVNTNLAQLETTQIYDPSIFRNDVINFFKDTIETKDIEDYYDTVISTEGVDNIRIEKILASDIVSGFDIYSPEYYDYLLIRSEIQRQFDKLRKYLIDISRYRYIRSLKRTSLTNIKEVTIIEVPLLFFLLEYNDNVENFDDDNETYQALTVVLLFITFKFFQYNDTKRNCRHINVPR